MSAALLSAFDTALKARWGFGPTDPLPWSNFTPKAVYDVAREVMAAPAAGAGGGGEDEFAELRRLAEAVGGQKWETCQPQDDDPDPDSYGGPAPFVEVCGAPWYHPASHACPSEAEHPGDYHEADGGPGPFICTTQDPNADHDTPLAELRADFIAAANPAKILELLSRLSTTTAEAANERRIADEGLAHEALLQAELNEARSRLAAAEGENTRLIDEAHRWSAAEKRDKGRHQEELSRQAERHQAQLRQVLLALYDEDWLEATDPFKAGVNHERKQVAKLVCIQAELHGIPWPPAPPSLVADTPTETNN